MTDMNVMHKYIGEAAFVGVGGCGMNMLEGWLKKHLPVSVCTIGVNRDAWRLSKTTNIMEEVFLAEVSSVDGENELLPVTREQVQESMHRHMGELTGMLQDSSIVYLLAGLGGASGTWASQLICNHLQSIGKQVVVVLTMPFSFEKKRLKVAEAALADFDGLAHRIICYNDYLIQHSPEETSLEKAFEYMNDQAFESVKMADYES